MKTLKLLYQCDTYAELAGILGVDERTVTYWNRNGMQPNIKALLNVIEKQKKELDKLKEDKQ